MARLILLTVLACYSTCNLATAQQGELLNLEFSLPQQELNLLNNPPNLNPPQNPTPNNRFGARLPATVRPTARPFRPVRPRPNPAQARQPVRTAVQNRFNSNNEVPAPRRVLPTPRPRRPVNNNRRPVQANNRRPVGLPTPRPRRPITPRPAPTTTTTTTQRPAAPAPARSVSPFGPFRSVVTYLGTDFILPDGCPVKTCKSRDRNCKRRNFQNEEKYNSCLRGEDAQHMGCVTDILPTKKTITIPVYANFCSAYCYEEDYEDVKRLEHCPYKGFSHNNDAAQLF